MRAFATAIGRPKPGEHQSVAFTGTATTSATMSAQTYFVALYATEDCHITLDGTATTSDFFLPKETLVMFPVRPGETFSVIQATTGGNLHISEMDH